MSKPHIISAILEINRSASRAWLETFSAADLRRYLDHLQVTLEPRGAASTWVRSGKSPAVVTRTPGIAAP